MRARHWAWLTAGLTAWAGVVALWATGPYDCQPPDQHGQVHCR